MAALATLRTLAPELAQVGNDHANDVIEVVTLWVDSAAFGARTTEAIARLAAHEITMQERAKRSLMGNVPTGAPQSLTIPKAAMSWGDSAPPIYDHQDAYYRSTVHGRAFLDIRDSRAPVGFGVVTGA